jgi:predicted hydrocarbon binding protein
MLNKFLDKYIFTNTLRYIHNNFFLVNIPFLIMPVDLLSVMSGSEDLGKQKEIYSFFKDSSKKNFMPRFNELKIDDNTKLDFIKNFFVASGWGAIQIIDFDKSSKQAILIVDNSPFAQQLNGKTKKPADTIIRGVFSGMFSIIFEEDVDCVEIECFALNDKSCKFIVKPKNEFDFEKQVVRDQLNL